MGRELRRKQAKKEGKGLERPIVKEKNMVKELVKITVLLIFIIGIIYLISALFITKELKWFESSDNKSEVNSVTNSILASTIFNQKEEEYYVYFYDFDNEKIELTNLITNKLTGQKIYRVDTSSDLNSKYISDVGNKNAKTLEDLKIKTPTLIKISGDVISEYYENEEISNIFN